MNHPFEVCRRGGRIFHRHIASRRQAAGHEDIAGGLLDDGLIDAPCADDDGGLARSGDAGSDSTCHDIEQACHDRCSCRKPGALGDLGRDRAGDIGRPEQPWQYRTRLEVNRRRRADRHHRCFRAGAAGLLRPCRIPRWRTRPVRACVTTSLHNRTMSGAGPSFQADGEPSRQAGWASVPAMGAAWQIVEIVSETPDGAPTPRPATRRAYPSTGSRQAVASSASSR